MIFMTALGQPMLFLNTQKTASDLLEKRSSIYIDRPRFIVVGEIITRGMSIAMSQSTDLWRRMRRAAVESFSKNAVKNYHAIQTREAVFFTSNVVSRPADIEKHIRRTTASIILSVAYDRPSVEGDDDRTVLRVNEHSEKVAATAAIGAHWVEFLPWMKHIPSRFAKWKRDAEYYYEDINSVYQELFSKVQNDLANGIDRPSMSANLLKNQDHFKLSGTERVWTAGVMFGAASETTAATLSWWFFAMVAYPQTQVRAQEELDKVVGRGRLPSFSDRPHLPYTHAIVKEVLRWRPPVRLGIPHVSIADDWYEGMFIPKGTMCISNIWQCNHQADIYGPDVDEFRPARFLDEHGELVEEGPTRDVREGGHVSYGYGRRLCVGQYLANDSVFINIATMLWAARFEHEKEGNGQEVSLDADSFIGNGIVSRPVSIPYRITPRFPEAVAMLAEARELQR
ncbi:cytochrome P450 [Multifurca ochricompacta]|uniref:Cytochrome P450 n=1 Tax=Multifurca ochricompacta TaxID=376703 RepID=A0AAD4M6U3_9AGAM|nr:cytochrome P450 [Multifurca ochricompacta]